MASGKPHIIFFLIDDVGWNDLGYNSEDSPIPTPNIDALAKQGIQLKSHYMHTLCTPSRAALMTGRYHLNTGLNYVIAPSNPAGLPDNIPTLPEVLKTGAGYHTAMAGKWHLGSAQRKFTPTGKGFEDFTGMYMWDLDSYTKQMYATPWAPAMMIDWVKEYSNGTFHHYAEPKHATEAITEAAISHIDSHNDGEKALFLYVAFTAAHSPLQPLPRHAAQCEHIAQSWRRDFCGMVVGADEAIQIILDHTKALLGDNVLAVITSDNGGSVWFGGMNAPLRGSKATPLEGGTRVPAVIVDLSYDQRYLGYRGSSEVRDGVRVYNGLMHVADWMPTLLSYANISKTRWPDHLDGHDFSNIFPLVPYTHRIQPSLYLNISYGYTLSPRSEMLYDLYVEEEFLFKEALSSYRIGQYKLIEGPVRDDNYYFESATSQLNSTDYSDSKLWTERLTYLGEYLFGIAPFDQLRTYLVYGRLHNIYTSRQKANNDTVRLFDLLNDPLEARNLAHLEAYENILAGLRQQIKVIQQARTTPIQRAYLQLPLDEVWQGMHVPGDCSMNPLIKPQDCRFVHSWIPDDVDPWTDSRLLSATDYLDLRLQQLGRQALAYIAMSLLALLALYFWRSSKKNRKKKGE